MVSFASKLKNFAKTAVFAGAFALPYTAAASPLRILPDYSVNGEMGYEISKHERIAGYAHIEGRIDLFSYDNLTFGIGSRFTNYFRKVDKVTTIQPDVINYDLWPKISYNTGLGKFGLSYLHQCMHNVDEKSMSLIDDSRTHNIVLLDYENRVNFLEGLKLKLGLGPYVFVSDSGYSYYLSAEAELDFAKLTENLLLYVRARQNPIVAEKGDRSFLQFNFENELGLKVVGEKINAQIFVRQQRLEDYLTFDSGASDLFFVGLRFR